MVRKVSRPVCGRGRSLAVGVAVLVLALVGAAPVLAGPVWQLDSAVDSPVAPGSSVTYHMRIADVGDEEAKGALSPVRFQAQLPAGVTAEGVRLFYTAVSPSVAPSEYGWSCDDGSGGPVAGASTIACTNATLVAFAIQASSNTRPYLIPQLTVVAHVDAGASGTLTAAFGLSGGGAEPVSTVAPVVVSGAPAAFGLAAFDVLVGDGFGDPFTQAGGHPAEDATTLVFNRRDRRGVGQGDLEPVEAPKDVVVDLPQGFIGNPSVLGRCTAAQLANGFIIEDQVLCPPDSQVGTMIVHLNEQAPDLLWGVFPVYNMVPPPGVPARFGVNVAEQAIIAIDARVRARRGGDGAPEYVLSVDSHNINDALGVGGVSLNLWGVPGDPNHDSERHCPGKEKNVTGCKSGNAPQAFLRNPTSCVAPAAGIAWSAHADSWVHPGALTPAGSPELADPAWKSATMGLHELPGYPAPPAAWGPATGSTECGQVPFSPQAQLAPTSSAADSPSGLDVAFSVPQEALDEPGAIAQADIRRISVVLPEGMSVNPAAANGLQACSVAQIDLYVTSPAGCPDASKVGTAEIKTPLLSEPLQGSVYLAAQGENPFGSLLAVYLVAEGSGVIVKFAGHIEANAVTGRLTVTFDDLPQQPVESVKLHLSSGTRAPLVTPSACGEGAVSSTLEGWNGKSVSISNPYTVECTPGMGGFAPSFQAGTVNAQAGAFSPFTLTFSRQDGEQGLGGLTLRTPPGLLGVLKSAVQCPEPQASQGACGEGSLIGHVTAAAGAGPDPYYVQGGRAYLTGPYKGSPFGLSVVVPAKAGPLDLGTVVIRSRIDVDPHTAQITITSDPFPTILQGLPLLVRTVNVTVDRPGFMFNPTNCSPLSIDGTLTSTQGATAHVSSHFQAANCATLPFKPKFTVSTQANTSKKNGASLDVKVGYPAGAQANIRSVAVTLPKALPSRLTTIQQACPEATFHNNPASCPAGSNIGIATAHTPVLTNPVVGPAYLVSHGGAAFPDLVLILQGEGVTLELVGSINIKKSITRSAFNAVPDAPISSFELQLPEGPHSGLAAVLPARAKGSLCGTSLTMPTTMTGQNGAQIKQNTKIAVTGCPKAKKAKAKKKRRKKARTKKGSLGTRP